MFIYSSTYICLCDLVNSLIVEIVVLDQFLLLLYLIYNIQIVFKINIHSCVR